MLIQIISNETAKFRRLPRSQSSRWESHGQQRQILAKSKSWMISFGERSTRFGQTERAERQRPEPSGFDLSMKVSEDTSSESHQDGKCKRRRNENFCQERWKGGGSRHSSIEG
jgi:hypothetical protein